VGGRLGHFHFMGRIQIGPYVSDTRIQATTYPDFLVSAHRWCSHVEEKVGLLSRQSAALHGPLRLDRHV
jgi:hypothetical protein